MTTTDWAERWAKDFHETYEQTAPKFGYETRKESAKPWEEVPEANRKLMIAVCAEGPVQVYELAERSRGWGEGGEHTVTGFMLLEIEK